jgi:DNA protecting protein DprA
MKITRLTIEQFPFLLRNIDNPPPHLDCVGALPPGEDYRYLCVIGSRHPSDYGVETCKALIAGLRDYPVVIVSGLAIGIDSVAHRAALENKMKTIAFPGSGLNRSIIYPYTHVNLADKIVESGNTLLSSFKTDQIGAYWTFPARNRLMAGSSHATLIIEGRQGSGTLLTAEYALQFNRDVLIVPGSIFSDLSFGPHKLHKEGATPVANSREILAMLGFDVDDPDDDLKKPALPIIKPEKSASNNSLPDNDRILCKIPIRYQAKPKRAQLLPEQLSFVEVPAIKASAVKTPTVQPSLTNSPPAIHPLNSLSKEEFAMVRLLQYSSLSGSKIVEKTGLSASKVNVILSELELKGLVKQDGAVYRCWIIES